jgi:CelD/BcsL family acetyltransferase involved in cellulose biosynthesis
MGWHSEVSHPAPELRLGDLTFEGWLATKSSNFRQQIRRGRRQLEARGATFRMSRSPEELDRDLDSFARLHRARWSHRGGSEALPPGVERMVRHAAHELLADERFRLFCIDVDGRTIAAEVFLAAGGELSYWLGGFDDGWAAQRPSLLGIVQAIEDGLSRGDAHCDLGPGGQSYKYRLADSEQRAEWLTMVPPGRRAALAYGALAPRRAWRVAPEGLRSNVRKLRRPRADA